VSRALGTIKGRRHDVGGGCWDVRRAFALAVGSAVALALVAGLAAGNAAASSGDNFNGRFTVHEVTTSFHGIVNELVGRRFTVRWQLTPTCQTGACTAMLVSSSGLIGQVSPSGSGYSGVGTAVTSCIHTTPPYSVIVPRGLIGTVRIHITPLRVAQGAIRQFDGTLSYTFHATPAAAAHHCVPGVETRSLEAVAIPGTVKSAGPPPTTTTTTVPASSSGHHGSGRSTIATSLEPVRKAFPAGRWLLLDALFALLAVLLITFPAQLFNRTLDENYEEITGIIHSRLPFLRRYLDREESQRRRHSLLVLAGVVVLGALIGGFNDPTFGLNGHSTDTLVAVLIAFIVGVLASIAVGVAYRALQRVDRTPSAHARPGGLAVAIACVVVSRLAHFEPGYLYGVVAGAAFQTKLTRRQQGHEVALLSLATLAIAFGAWALWTPVNSAASAAHHPGTMLLIADTLLASIFVAGVINTVINLLPIETLAGRTLFNWHRGAWAVTFFVSVFLFVDVMLLPAARAQRASKAPILVTFGLFAVFAALSITFNRYFAFRHRRTLKTRNATM
jgi:hypothetical protein